MKLRIGRCRGTRPGDSLGGCPRRRLQGAIITVDIRPIRLPDHVGAIDDAELAAYGALLRRLDVEALGTSDLTRRPEEVLQDLRRAEFTRYTAIGAFDADRLVGLVEVQWELDADAATAYIDVLGVEPDRRREGIGSGLLARAEEAAHAAGRPATVLSADHLIGAEDAIGPRLHAPQGEAGIAADAPAARFALAHGFALGQLYRVSAMDVAGRGDEFRFLSTSLERASDRYRLVAWHDEAPDELIDSLAVAHERMSVDPPAGAIAWGLEQWDAARIRDGERRARQAGRTHLNVVAVAPDGEVAGFTELSLLPDSPAVEQWDTIVLAPHRGHRLGMRLKLANLVALDEFDPTRERIYTWNADENEHMLAINVALGFRPFALESTWQRPPEASGAAGSAGTGATTGS